MGQRNTNPSDHGAESGDVGQPVEGVVGALLAASEVAEASERRANGKSVDGYTVLHDAGENAGGLSFLCEHEKRTRAGVKELVAGRECGGKDDRIFKSFSMIDNVRRQRHLLMMCDKTLIPETWMMMTNGD